METTGALPDASDEQVAVWLENIARMRPDILKGFAERVPQRWSEASLVPVMGRDSGPPDTLPERDLVSRRVGGVGSRARRPAMGARRGAS